MTSTHFNQDSRMNWTSIKFGPRFRGRVELALVQDWVCSRPGGGEGLIIMVISVDVCLNGHGFWSWSWQCLTFELEKVSVFVCVCVLVHKVWRTGGGVAPTAPPRSSRSVPTRLSPLMTTVRLIFFIAKESQTIVSFHHSLFLWNLSQSTNTS